ncbi:MAG: hypothetical protein KGJ77_11015 [Acidobacteriota bacterium]|nr:hypothetical protein [Acidobacteriota bacterium]
MAKWSRVALVLTVPAALVTGVSGAASARPHAVAKGSITCTVVSGKVKFTPPLTRGGTSNAEVVRFGLKVTGCTPGDGSNLKSVQSRFFRITMPVPATTNDTANSCPTAMPPSGSLPGTGVGRWRSRGYVVSPTRLATTGENWNMAGTDVTVSIPGSNGSATNNGTSFAGYDNGANSTISLTLGLTPGQYSAVCDPVVGAGRLVRAMITGGRISLGPTLFSAYTGSSAWVTGNDPLVPTDADHVVLDLNSPYTTCASNGYTGCSYAGMTLPGVTGLPLSRVTALKYDLAVQTPGWSSGDGGSPRLVLLLSDNGNVQLYAAGTVTAGTWVHLDALTGAVDNVNGTGESCGTYQITWSAAVACHGAATIVDAFIVNDSGWVATSGFDVWVDNMTLGSTVTSSSVH